MFLAVDVGASKVRVGAFSEQNGRLRMTHVDRFVTKEWGGVGAVLKRFVSDKGISSVDAVAVGVAGPVSGRRVKMTNLPWVIDAESLEKEIGCRRAIVMNDLAAHGYGIEELSEGDYVTLREGEAKPGNRALIAAGSGLGECILYWTGGQFFPSPSEGGHGTFSPRNALELSLAEFLLERYPGHVSWERVVSGHHGFRNLYDFLKKRGDFPAPTELDVATTGKAEIGPELLQGWEKGNPLARRTLSLFFELYGAEAGNLALKALALNGVYLAGGIARRMLPQLEESGFLDAFSSKGRMSGLLSGIPIYVITDPESPIKGLARCARLSLLETP